MISATIMIPISVFNITTYAMLNDVHEWFLDNGIRMYAVNRIDTNVVEIDIWGLHAEQDMVAFKLKFGI